MVVRMILIFNFYAIMFYNLNIEFGALIALTQIIQFLQILLNMKTYQHENGISLGLPESNWLKIIDYYNYS